MTDAVANRWDFVLLFDVADGNPNGDPDAGNLPRVDPETGQGLVTDVALKRKLRNYVGLARGNRPPHEIYVRERAVLNNQHKRGYEGAGIALDEKKRKGAADADKVRAWMCANFYDIRTFGAVMTTDVNAGQVRGPVQLTFARSIGRVLPLEHTITRMAVATEAEQEKQQGENRTMGRKTTIPYGLYRAHGFVNPMLAQQTGFTTSDLDLLWEGLWNMFEHDRSAARGMMATRALYRFRHDSALGNAPAHDLFARVTVEPPSEGVAPRSFGGFQVDVDSSDLPAGITLIADPVRPRAAA
jgi:CRISPR-associated protein Csd2